MFPACTDQYLSLISLVKSLKKLHYKKQSLHWQKIISLKEQMYIDTRKTKMLPMPYIHVQNKCLRQYRNNMLFVFNSFFVIKKPCKHTCSKNWVQMHTGVYTPRISFKFIHLPCLHFRSNYGGRNTRLKPC